MITISNLSKNFDQRMLLNNVSLSIYPNEKIGLTGPNGAGKTTLFSIILGEMESSAGQIQTQKGLNIGYLPQESHFDSRRTILEELTAGDHRILALKEEQAKLEAENKADTMRYGDVLHELEQLGIYELEHKAKKVLSGLGFREQDFDRPIQALSGGWQMRTLLAKLLTYQYDLLLLDEPTNYLDLAATLWLKDFLKNYRGTFVMISHDKVFLNEVTNYTIVLEYGRLAKVKGNYQQYEELRAQRQESSEKQYREIEKKKVQLERFTQRFHAQPNRASAVQNKRKMLDRMAETMEGLDIPQDRQSIKEFEFPITQQSGYNVVTLENISKAYGDLRIYDKLDFELTRGQKLCFVGENGAGKSTLLKMLAGILPADSGTRKLGFNVSVGYFSQTRLDVLNPNRNVMEEVASAVEGSVPAVKIRSLLGLFNFRGDDVFKPISVLSGGEKSRVILAKLLINPPNFILLDEPTTHLDVDGVEALTRAFKEYEGTLCFISHDLFFVKEIANHIVEVDTGRLKAYPGGLDYYLSKREEQRVEEDLKRRDEQKQGAKKRESKESTNPKLDELHQKHAEALKRLSDIKKEVAALEREKKDLETESYVKARILAEKFTSRNPEALKEIGQRLKFIERRSREIDTLVSRLNDEKREINK